MNTDIILLILFFLATAYTNFYKKTELGKVVFVATCFFIINTVVGLSTGFIDKSIAYKPEMIQYVWAYYAIICMINVSMLYVYTNHFITNKLVLTCTSGLVLYPWFVCLSVVQPDNITWLYNQYPTIMTLLYIGLLIGSLIPTPSTPQKRRCEDGKFLLNDRDFGFNTHGFNQNKIFHISGSQYDGNKSNEASHIEMEGKYNRGVKSDVRHRSL